VVLTLVVQRRVQSEHDVVLSEEAAFLEAVEVDVFLAEAPNRPLLDHIEVVEFFLGWQDYPAGNRRGA